MTRGHEVDLLTFLNLVEWMREKQREHYVEPSIVTHARCKHAERKVDDAIEELRGSQQRGESIEWTDDI